VTTESTQPPPPAGGNAKYALIGLLLLLGAAAMYFFTRPEPAPPVVADETPVDAGIVRPPPAYEPDIEIPDEVPDAGPQDSGPIKRRIIYVDRRDSWDCSGNIPVASIRQVISRERRQVRNCYERRLKVNNTLQGNVNVRVRVGASGNVSAVQVGGSLRDREVFSCVRNLANRWRFPAPSGGRCAVIAAPFSLSPRR
jgi:outer membrane biosynthesis protein TonB